MLALFLSNVLTLMLDASALKSPVDTTDIYIIDGKRIENFDGSQINKKVIQSYKIERVPGSALRIHSIYTDKADKTYYFPYLPETGGMTIVNGKVIHPDSPYFSERYDYLSEYFDYLPQGSIIMGDKKGMVQYEKSDVVVKTGPGRATLYGFDNAVYVLNGKKISKKDFDRIDLSKIISVSIIKDSKEIQKYDVGKYKTVISITTQ